MTNTDRTKWTLRIALAILAFVAFDFAIDHLAGFVYSHWVE